MSQNETTCQCRPCFGQLIHSTECGQHERCEWVMDGLPLRCVLTSGHKGDHQ